MICIILKAYYWIRIEVFELHPEGTGFETDVMYVPNNQMDSRQPGPPNM